jgi:SMC interacting uncharacterized protein involved in chromosome segregation
MKKNLKKIGILLVLSCFFLNSSLVLAANPNSGERQGSAAVSSQQADKQQGKVNAKSQQGVTDGKPKGQVFKEMIQERKQSYQQIRERRKEMIKLQTEFRAIHSQVIRKINELRQQKEPLNEEQINKLKEGLQVIKADNKEFKNELGNIHREVVSLRVNQNNQEHEQTMECLQDIIVKQEERIEMLKKAVADMKAILEI